MSSLVKMEDIPSELILNWDQTALTILSMDDGKKGSKRV